MATLEELRSKIESTEELQSVVKTMKTIAAVSIRQYEKAVESLTDFSLTVEMGFQVMLHRSPTHVVVDRPESARKLAAVVFGSDQGMCGQFNEQIAAHAAEGIRHPGMEPEDVVVISVGERVVGPLEGHGFKSNEVVTLPGSIGGIGFTVQDLLLKIEKYREKRGINHVILYHNRPLSGSSYKPVTWRVLPLDREWLDELGKREWKSSTIPMLSMDFNPLFSVLVRYYLYVSFFRSLAESLAAENASRIASMQAAENNIEEELDTLNAHFRHERQRSITEELLDIVSGFEALK